MATRGRPPKAPQLRIADGTHRKHRHGSKEQYGAETVIEKVPKVPDNKSEVFSRYWKRYCQDMLRVGVLTSRDLSAIEQLCDAHDDQDRAQQAIARDGDYVTTQGGGVQRHPGMLTIEKARLFIMQAQVALGFTPIGRVKVPPKVAASVKSNKVAGLDRKM